MARLRTRRALAAVNVDEHGDLDADGQVDDRGRDPAAQIGPDGQWQHDRDQDQHSAIVQPKNWLGAVS